VDKSRVGAVLGAAVGAVVSVPAAAATLQVGPGQTYAMPCDAIAAASAGDVIQVDSAGSYDGNTCAWTTDGLTITGVNGRAKIDLTGVTPAQEKGIFTIGGTASATIENFELSGAAISQADGNNGAGIRHQGLNLTVRNCYIHDNQDGILGAPATANTGTVLIESSEFSHNGAGDGYSHNMYIGDYAEFTLQFSYSHLAVVGHLVKSRAYLTNVWYNRLGRLRRRLDVDAGRHHEQHPLQRRDPEQPGLGHARDQLHGQPDVRRRRQLRREPHERLAVHQRGDGAREQRQPVARAGVRVRPAAQRGAAHGHGERDRHRRVRVRRPARRGRGRTRRRGPRNGDQQQQREQRRKRKQ
jgi:hypothetical protein